MSRLQSFMFRLYVAGDTQNSTQAIANLKALCQAHMPNQHNVEIVNVFQHPKRAMADGVFLTPTLLKLTPSPIQRIVGTLSQAPGVLQTLGLA